MMQPKKNNNATILEEEFKICNGSIQYSCRSQTGEINNLRELPEADPTLWQVVHHWEQHHAIRSCQP